jgi:predicted metal-dependent hydrolase
VATRTDSPDTAEAPALEIDGSRVPLSVRRSRRARRLSLRVDPTLPPEFPVELVLPQRIGLAEGLRFAHEMRAWIARRIAALPPLIRLVDGATIEFGGSDLIIRHVGGAGLTRRDGAALLVTGAAEHTGRRTRDWLKSRARETLTARSRAMAARIGREVRRVRLGDPKSRWGSCAPGGRLAYSWRLILAPDFVLDYVVAHEVAHLIHPHHGPRFWRLVSELCGDVEAPRAWLNRHGPRLLRYG